MTINPVQTRMRIECRLGDMDLEVEAEDEETAEQVFERVWKERIAEKQRAEAFSSRKLEKQEWFGSIFD